MRVLKFVFRRKAIPLLIGIVLATFFLVVGLTYPDPCPGEYTQEQIDRSNCTVGAVIGPTQNGMYYLAAFFFVVFGVCWLVANKRWISERLKQRRR